MKLSEQSKQSFLEYQGFEYPDDLEFDYNFAWCSVDGVIQLFRMDMLSIGKRAIDAELNYLDGKLEPVLQKDGKYLLKEVKNDKTKT